MQSLMLNYLLWITEDPKEGSNTWIYFVIGIGVCICLAIAVFLVFFLKKCREQDKKEQKEKE